MDCDNFWFCVPVHALQPSVSLELSRKKRKTDHQDRDWIRSSVHSSSSPSFACYAVSFRRLAGTRSNGSISSSIDLAMLGTGVKNEIQQPPYRLRNENVLSPPTPLDGCSIGYRGRALEPLILQECLFKW
jgi:hypothetical protein